MEDDQVVERGSLVNVRRIVNSDAGSVQLQSDDIELQKSLTLFSVIQRFCRLLHSYFY